VKESVAIRWVEALLLPPLLSFLYLGAVSKSYEDRVLYLALAFAQACLVLGIYKQLRGAMSVGLVLSLFIGWGFLQSANLAKNEWLGILAILQGLGLFSAAVLISGVLRMHRREKNAAVESNARTKF
jgi:hypothetical protein